MENNTFKIVTLGCKVNSYESQGIEEYLLKNGFKESKDPEYIIVNTCAVTKTAEKKCLTKVRSLSEHFNATKICIVGCSSSIRPEEFLNIPGVNVVSGNNGKLFAVKELLNGKTGILLSKKNTRNEKFEEDIKISNFGKECRAFVKIQDGCDNFCSYCIIPRTRGNSRSRSHEEIIEEVKRLYKSDYRELVITGIDMGSYEDPNDAEYKLDDLIEDIIINTPDDYRFRISSLETSQMTQKLLDLFINHSDKLVSHVHIPLQSGSSEIVKAMHRKYDLEEFVEKVNYLRKHLPYLALSTDVIVGFPGETEDLFMETYKFIEKLKFMRLHVFPYSPRPGTLAASLKDQIPGNIKKERVHRLIDLGNKLQEEYIKFCNGQTFVFLAEKVIKKDGKLIYQGYLDNYLEISVECEKDILSKLVKVKVDNGKFLIV